MKNKLPKLSKWLLSKIHSDYNHSPTLGDLDEEFLFICENESLTKAKRWYRWQVLKSLPASLNHIIFWSVTMFKNYFKIAFRIMVRQKVFSSINVFGLAAGMACFILMMLYVHNELSFDRFHKKSDQICRVIRHYEGLWGRPEALIGGTPAPLVPTMIREFPEVLNGTRIGEVEGIFRLDNQTFSDKGIYADEKFFEIFNFELKTGDISNSLKKPYSMILTESLAQKYFRNENPVGKTLNFSKQMNINRSGNKDENFDVIITGIIKDVVANSHLQFDFILSFNTIASEFGSQTILEDWGRSNYYNYVLLIPGTNPKDLHTRLADYSPRFRGTDEGKYILQPLSELHWDAATMDEMPGNRINDKKQLYLFSSIAFIILLIACINYMNLTTARYSKRIKEIGLRKVVGALKSQLIKQFMSEALLITFISFVLAIGLAYLFLPKFNNLANSSIKIEWFANSKVLVTILAMILFAGLVSGSYPALYLSSFQPVKILQGQKSKSKKGVGFRNVLVVIQFAISVGLIASTLVVSKQLNFIRDKDIGYNRERVVILPLRDENVRQKCDIIHQELLLYPQVENVAGSEYIPLEKFNVGVIKTIDKAGEEKNITAFTAGIGYDFFDVFKLELINGRAFSREFETDKNRAIILNETAVQLTDWQDPIGKIINASGKQVIGVVKDFHQSSLHEKIEPMIFYLTPENFTFLSVRINPGNIPGTIEFIKKTIEKHSLKFPFEYYFQDDYFNTKYKADEQFGRTFGFGAALAIGIACLGILGLAAYSTERRTKEIAVRKVLGAKISEIVFLLSKEFIKWVLLANLIAWPLAYFVGQKWLQNFAYKTTIGLDVFLISTLLALIIALITISSQSIKAAVANPVKSMRYE